jgi:hypothetical protein
MSSTDESTLDPATDPPSTQGGGGSDSLNKTDSTANSTATAPTDPPSTDGGGTQ